ncbi:hypothetical protein RRG08_021359 [Elysia crispata]|uniref:Uncharacterized protein n=1 Tax=Elysia crispata TaxID=231223 RepID=A0AAE1CW36_9GAST|nr:hypothetical protein RRG08_021359 [Elysia crispata]
MSLYYCIIPHLIFLDVEEKLYGEKYVLFIIGWYPDNWHKVRDNRHICTLEQLEETAQQFTEPLDRLISTPDISLITSQCILRSPWPKMLSGLWLLPSTVYLPSMYDEEKIGGKGMKLED